ncbi:putative LRR receptor-like serine/threonine-protein kinase [Acorus calamus]|uniref:LRR receptor-like serine/threonine-protein kinase n=1 Tax=Acorus calamus TaxID=4465 RepID=A0AAV9EQB2_ACOCL|nr:putative LRR receptor-like serine/threonine-protein kinase [Acorus calamus]
MVKALIARNSIRKVQLPNGTFSADPQVIKNHAVDFFKNLLNRERFISIDCGIPKNSDYTDDTYKITYTSDDEFIDTGVNAKISPAFMSANDPRKLYVTLRSFPNGDRNCYNLSPFGGSAKGNKYLIRASFMYGNYDGQNVIPQFDLHVGVNRWKTVELSDASSSIYYEIIHVSRTSNVSVCLVNTRGGVPFISGLELRQLDGDSYKAATEASSLVKFLRYNCGGLQDFIRFPDDNLDRIWQSYNQTTQNPISTTSNVNKNNLFNLPSAVMGTAVTPSTGDALEFDWQTSAVVGSNDGQHIYMHFSELQLLKTNESRKFGFEINGQSFYKPFQPDYLSVDTIFSPNPLNGTTYNVSLQKTSDSTLPPILNAVEVYFVRPMQISPTYDQDEINHEKKQNITSRDPVPCPQEQDVGGSHDKRSNNSAHPDVGQFTYAAIEKMTNNFDSLIGKGGYGTVYLGHKNDGTAIAVKVLFTQGTTEFRNEIEVLMKVQHENLVPFIGYCDDGIKKALIYEYMSGGNLKEHLGKDTGPAEWGQRLNIAIDVAKGLEHLHNECKPHIIHRDIKSENILLDENSVAKVADFGISRILPENVTSIITKVMGTVGYLDPEMLDMKKDVADPRFEGKYHKRSLEEAIQIARECTSSEFRSRPTMSVVVSKLGRAYDIDNAQQLVSSANE